MFSGGSSSEISFATVTPSCVTVGAPNFLSRDTLRPLGPRVTLTASARVSIPFFKERRASSVKTICLAISNTPLTRRENQHAIRNIFTRYYQVYGMPVTLSSIYVISSTISMKQKIYFLYLMFFTQ